MNEDPLNTYGRIDHFAPCVACGDSAHACTWKIDRCCETCRHPVRPPTGGAA